MDNANWDESSKVDWSALLPLAAKRLGDCVRELQAQHEKNWMHCYRVFLTKPSKANYEIAKLKSTRR